MWQSLEDMNKDEAMSQFVHCLSVACPQFTTHIAALQQHRNEQLLSKQWVFPPFLFHFHCLSAQLIFSVVDGTGFVSEKGIFHVKLTAEVLGCLSWEARMVKQNQTL